MKNTINELVEIKSFDTKCNKEIIDYLIEKFEPYSEEIIKIKNGESEKYNLIIGINTKVQNVNAILLSGHIDTVVADEKAYLTNPYKATLKDNKLYGLGIIDMKCYFASIIDNLEFLKANSVPIIVCVTCDEETELLGINYITQKLKDRNVKPIVSILGEPTQMKICNNSKSCYEYVVEVVGKSCHSSNPLNGINANYILAKIVLKIEELNNKYENTTLSCGIINGGTKVNIVPNFASCVFDIRSTNKQLVNLVLSEIENEIKKLKQEYKGSEITIKNTLAIPALESLPNKITNSVAKKFNIELNEFIGGCEAGYLQELGGEAFIFGTGDLALAHKPNEFMEISDFEKYNKMFCQIIKYLCDLKI